jgi:hypothetical protein
MEKIASRESASVLLGRDAVAAFCLRHCQLHALGQQVTIGQ